MAADGSVTVIAPKGENLENDVPSGNLFDGINFFLLQRVPLRGELIKRIRSNGGNIVKHEQAAHYLIADHARQDCPEGSVSWTFIDASFRAKVLANPEEHRIVSRHFPAPGRGTRTAFSADDDRVLWEWVEQAKMDGESVKGNEIYKRLETHNPRHTFHAWRDRYIKKLIDHPPAAAQSAMDTQTSQTRSPHVDRADIAASSVSKEASIRRSDEDTRQKPVSSIKRAVQVSQTHGLRSDADWQDRKAFSIGADQNLTTGKRSSTIQLASDSRLDATETDQDPFEGEKPPKRQKLTKDFTGNLPQDPDATRVSPAHSQLNEDQEIQESDLDASESVVKAGPPSIGNRKRSSSSIGNTKQLEKYVKPPMRGNLSKPAMRSSKTALTEANLASQQVLQRGPPVRGMDLPEDDDRQDQVSYAKYLRNLLRQNHRDTLPGSPDLALPIAAELEETGLEAVLPHSSKNALSPNRDRMPDNSTISVPTPSTGTRGTTHRKRPLPIPGTPKSDRPIDGRYSNAALDVNTDEMDVFQDHDTNDIDLTCPSPENGWGFDVSQQEPSTNQRHHHVDTNAHLKDASRKSEVEVLELSSQASSTSSDSNIHSTRGNNGPLSKDGKGTEVETQEIVNAETQLPDLDIPAPPHLDNRNGQMGRNRAAQLPSGRRRPAPSTRPREKDVDSADAVVDDLPTWAATMRNRGYTPVAIINALKVCSARTDLAELVLLEERSGRGLPKDIPGIWSEQEDEILESGDARGLRRLEEKHGWDDCQARLQHLADRRDS